MSAQVTHSVQMWLHGDSSLIPVAATFSWAATAPLEVRVRFHVSVVDEPVEWVFSRDLLGNAFSSEGVTIGLGDVQVRIENGWAFVFLTSPFGAASFQGRPENIEIFLRMTYDEVAPGDAESQACLDELEAFLA